MERLSWEEYKKRIHKSVEGFTHAATEAGDFETALEGHMRLGTLDGPEVVNQVKNEMRRLQESQDPTAKKRLQRISRNP